MAAESARKFEALEAQAATLVEMFRKGGYEQVAPSIIQPADILLDQIGEAIRGRTYVFTDLTGAELCLRPDLTVPVSRLYLERHPRADVEARYCYNGPAFRFQPKGASGTHPREFRQAGIECFGVADRDSADAEIVLLVADAVQSAGLKAVPLPLRRYRAVLCAARCAVAARALAAEAASLFLASAHLLRAAVAACERRDSGPRGHGRRICRRACR